MKILEVIFIASVCFTSSFTQNNPVTETESPEETDPTLTEGITEGTTDSHWITVSSTQFDDSTPFDIRTAAGTGSVSVITMVVTDLSSVGETIMTEASTTGYGETEGTTAVADWSVETSTTEVSPLTTELASIESTSTGTDTITEASSIGGSIAGDIFSDSTAAMAESSSRSETTTIPTQSTSIIDGATAEITNSGGETTTIPTQLTSIDTAETTNFESETTMIHGLFASVGETSVAVPNSNPMLPSIIRSPLESVIYRIGDNVTLDCKGKGVPAVTYEWKKKDIKLNETLQNIRRGADGTIVIQSATSIDEGFYQCFVKNQHGTDISETARLQMAFIGSTTRNVTDVLNKTVQEGNPVHILCDAPSSFPKPTYGWELVNDTEDEIGVPLQLTNRIQIAGNGDLHIAYALPDDDIGGSIYRCTTNNSYLGVVVKGGHTQLTVTRNQFENISEFAPTEAFASTEFPKGLAIFRCFFYGYPVPTIIWTGPNDTLPNGRYRLNEFNTSLTIDTIKYSDEGDYNCTALNNQGFYTRTFSLRVGNAPTFPKINDAPYDVSVTDGDSVIFHCNATGKPAAKIVWLQDGKELDPGNPPTRYIFSNDNRSLTIRNVCRDCVDRESKTDETVIQCNASNVHGYAVRSGHVSVIPKYCEDALDKHRPTILWSRTIVGTRIYRPCPDDRYGEKYGMCSRKCFLNDSAIPVWSNTSCTLCYDKKFEDLKTTVSDLNAIALKNQTVVAEIANEISTLTNKSDGLSSGNLKVAVEMLSQLAILRSNSTDIPSANELESFVQATSNVLRPINSEKWKEIEEINETFASAILFSVDVYGRSLSMLNISSCGNEKGATNLVLEAWSLEKSSQPPPSEFPNCSVWGENKISMSTQATNTSISSERFHPATRMWASYYQTIHDYLPGNEKLGKISSKVLSFSIDGLEINEQLEHPVIITLQHTKEEGEEEKDITSFITTCAFWNFNRSDWDSTGCSVISTTLTHTICSCDHLTNFAILMRGSSPSMSVNAAHYTYNKEHKRALSIITIIGCSISIVALILTIIVYALTWKQAKSAQAAVLLNLCVALIIAYIIFMTGADKFQYEVGCIVVAVLLHYFFLAAFFIMLAEGVELLLYIIFVFHVRRTKETFMLIASAWVLPLIIVTVSVVYTKLDGYGNYRSDGNETTKPLLGNDNYGNGYKNDSNNNETSDGNHGVGDVCWLSVEKGFIWAFIGPVLCIVAVNIAILITVLVWMSERRSVIANNEKKRNEIRATIWNLSVTCPVLGLGWIFGVFTIVFDNVAFQYVFVITNTLQGLFIFIFHALFHNKKVKESISDFYTDYICGCRKTVYGVSNKMSSTQELAKNKDNPGSFQMTGHDNKGLEAQESFLSAGTQTTSIDESGTLETTP